MSSKVSVVTITFNLLKAGREKSFVQCLESVHNQTYKNIEHWVIDGGSTDGTVDLIQQYAKKNWIKYISEPDHGIYDAMNKGIRCATGNYVAFLNSDDFWHNNRGVEFSVRALDASQAAFSFSPSYTLFHDRPAHKVFTSIGSVLMRMPFCHQTMFTRRDVLIKEGMFDDANFKSAADFNLILRLCLAGYKSIFVPEIFTSYRHGGFSATDIDISTQECIKSFYMEYKKIDSSFSLEDAAAVYRDKTFSQSFLHKVLPHLHKDIQNLFEHLPKTEIAPGKIKVMDPEYSYPMSIHEVGPGYPPVLLEQRTWKTFGIPFMRLKLFTNGKEFSFLGLPLYRRKDQQI